MAATVVRPALTPALVPSGSSSLVGSLSHPPGTANTGGAPPSPESTSFQSTVGTFTDVGNVETIDYLRGEVGDLRSELEILRSLLGDNVHQRDEAWRISSGTSRIDKLQRRKAEAESQLREAHAEAHRLRLQLARCQREYAQDHVEVLRVGSRVELDYQGKMCRGTIVKLPQDDLSGQWRYTVHCDGDKDGLLTFAASVRLLNQAYSSRSGSASPRGSRRRLVAASGQRTPCPAPGLRDRRDRRNRPRSPRSGSPRSRATVARSMPRSMSAEGLVSASSRSAPSRSSAPAVFGLAAGDEMDEMWCRVLQLFPEYPNWVLVKEKPGVYRMGHPLGKKILCKISHDGLQVRVGGGWVPAVSFLERHGPGGMSARPDSSPSRAMGLSGSCSSLDQVELPPSMERLLLPTKAWAQKIGINTTPDIREQRRHVAAEDPMPYTFKRQTHTPRIRDDYISTPVTVPTMVVVQPTVRKSESQPVVLTRSVASSPASVIVPLGGATSPAPSQATVLQMGYPQMSPY